MLDRFDLTLVERLLRHPPREPEYRGGRPHRAFLANLGLGRPAIEAAVRRAFGATAVRHEWPTAVVARLVTERYSNPAWVGRLG
jgi:lipoate-protein ligase A